MKNKLIIAILILSNLVIVPAFGMEEEADNASDSKQLLAWVATANYIHVKHPQLNEKFQIDGNTTIDDIKKQLLENEGIPVAQQTLYAVPKNRFGFAQTTNTTPLLNNKNIKEIMSEHNTNELQLYLKLRADSPE